MEVIFKERQLIFTREELNSTFAEGGELHATLFSVMAYPENEEKQNLYRLGLRAEHLDTWPAEAARAFLSGPENQELLYDLYKHKEDALKVYRSGRIVRKRGHHTGALFVRGVIAGWLLVFRATCCKSMVEANNEVQDQFRQLKEPINFSLSTIKTIWNEYYNVAHLWGVYSLFLESPTLNNNNPWCLSHFIDKAKYLRIQLIDITGAPGSGRPINRDRRRDSHQIWRIVIKDYCPITKQPIVKDPFYP